MTGYQAYAQAALRCWTQKVSFSSWDGRDRRRCFRVARS
jgi:hypothetical protein